MGISGVWSVAQNAADMMAASVAAFQTFERISRIDGPYDADTLKSAMGLVRAVVVTMMEGYQGKLRGRQICDALALLNTELDRSRPSPAMIEKFKAAF